MLNNNPNNKISDKKPNAYIIKQFLIVSFFSIFVSIIYYFMRFYTPYIGTNNIEIHLAVIMIGSLLLTSFYLVFMFCLISAILCTSIGGFGFQALPLDYFLVNLICGTVYFLKVIAKQKKLYLKVSAWIVYTLIAMVGVFLTHVISGTIFYGVDPIPAFVFVIMYTGFFPLITLVAYLIIYKMTKIKVFSEYFDDKQ